MREPLVTVFGLKVGVVGRPAGAVKQLTAVVRQRQRRRDGVEAGGQQQLGQHAGADPLQMFHGQLTDAEAQIRQDLLSGGTLEQKENFTGRFPTFKGLFRSLNHSWCLFFSEIMSFFNTFF